MRASLIVWKLVILGALPGAFLIGGRCAESVAPTAGLYEIRKGGRGGYMDYSGKVIVEPKYQSVKPFSDGVGVISDTNIGILLFDS